MTRTSSESPASRSPIAGAAPGLVMLAGAAVYAVLQGLAGVTFNATPFSVGLIVLCAGLVGRRHHLLPTAMVLTGWGAAVLLVHAGVVPGERTTPAYMVGIGLGCLPPPPWRLGTSGANGSRLRRSRRSRGRWPSTLPSIWLCSDDGRHGHGPSWVGRSGRCGPVGGIKRPVSVQPFPHGVEPGMVDG